MIVLSELNEFLKVLAEGKKQKEQEIQESKKELGDFLSVVAEAKAQDPKHQMLKEVKKHVQQDIVDMFGQMTQAKPADTDPPIAEERVLAVEAAMPEVTPAAEMYTKAEIDDLLKRNASFQQPDPKIADPNITALQQKLKFLEQAIGKIAATGPGGGAGEIYNLDMPTRQVTGDYEINRKDYYVGVNCDIKSYITLPTPDRNLKNGRVVIVKDESGHAQLTPIKIIGTIDNDPNGAEIRINNGAIQFIYRDGWRIV